MGASRKKTPDLLSLLHSHWPDALSGHCALELGLSGGLDSVVLLHLLSRLRGQRDFSLAAVHVHHGLSPNADQWAAFCQQLCLRLNIPLRVERVSVVRAGGQSLEAQARAARYAAFSKTHADAMVLAQHQDDLAETVLLQTLRGGGPHALAAMPTWRLEQGLALWRPLLSVPRFVLQQYAAEHGLAWVEDESNADSRFLRNWLRNQWLPELERRLPSYRAGLERSAGLMADAAQLLDEVAAEDLARIAEGGRLALGELLALSPARQRLLLLRWVERYGLGLPTPDALEAFRQQIQSAAPDKQPLWQLPAGQVFRYRGWLWAEQERPQPQPYSFNFDPSQTLLLPEWGGWLGWRPDARGIGGQWQGATLWLRPRQGGERLAQSYGTKPVKTQMQEAGLPPPWRARWPLLYDEKGVLLAVAGLAVADTARDVGGNGWWPEWTPD